MEVKANALKVRNIVLTVLCGMLVPIARALDRHTAVSADSAAWLTPFVALLLFIPYVLLLTLLLRQYPGQSLMSIHRQVFGKVLGKIVNLLYALWFLMLTGYYLCQYGERMSTTIFFDTDRAIFVTAMLVVLSFCLSKGQEGVLRASGLFFFAVMAVFLVSLALLAPNVKLTHHLPVTVDLVPGVFTGGVQIFSVLTYFITVPMFFDKVDGRGFGKELAKGGAFALLLSFLAIFVLVGIFSAPLATSMPFPYFSAIKEIRLFNSVERLEAMIFSVLMLSDFLLLVLFVLCTGHCAKDVFCLKQPLRFDLFLLAAFTVSLFFSYGAERLNEISYQLIIPVNLVIGAGLPLFASVVSFFRERIRKKTVVLSGH